MSKYSSQERVDGIKKDLETRLDGIEGSIFNEYEKDYYVHWRSLNNLHEAMALDRHSVGVLPEDNTLMISLVFATTEAGSHVPVVFQKFLRDHMESLEDEKASVDMSQGFIGATASNVATFVNVTVDRANVEKMVETMDKTIKFTRNYLESSK